MKVLIVGDGVEIYSNAFYKAFQKSDNQTKEFNWSNYFFNNQSSLKLRLNRLSHKIQNKL